jgi:CheY-like chemotaxis protein
MSKRILIAEDDEYIRELLTMQAEKRGYEVTAVVDGLGYLVAVSKNNYDLILTDILMPELNGASATEIMKLQGCTVPVIALTALDAEGIKLIESKFERVFHKPLDLNELFKYVETWLGN